MTHSQTSPAPIHHLLSSLESSLSLKETHTTNGQISGAFSTLLKHQQRSEYAATSGTDITHRFRSLLFLLRKNRLFDRANALELLFQRLIRSNTTESDAQSVLLLLLSLTGDVTASHEKSNGTSEFVESLARSIDSADVVLPRDSFKFHGETSLIPGGLNQRADLRSTFYPESIFEAVPNTGHSSTGWSQGGDVSILSEIMQKEPGPCTSGSNLWSSPSSRIPLNSMSCMDPFARTAGKSVWGDPFKASEIDETLRESATSLRVDSLKTGVISNLPATTNPSNSSFCSDWQSVQSQWKSGKEESQSVKWINAADKSKTNKTRLLSWDSGSLLDGQRFISNASTAEFNSQFTRWDGRIEAVVCESEVVDCALKVLQGLPSHLFHYSEETQMFKAENCRLKSSSFNSMSTFMDQMARIGSEFKRLDTFALYFLENTDEVGFISQTFGVALRDFLCFVRASILEIPSKCLSARQRQESSFNPESNFRGVPSMLELSNHSIPLAQQLHALCTICRVHIPITESQRVPGILPHSLSGYLPGRDLIPDHPSKFTRGAALLSFLHEHDSTSAADARLRPLMRFAFRKCARAFVRMLDSWIFRGVVSDPHSEFLSVSFQDGHIDQTRLALPTFLEEIRAEIIRCGESLALLRSASLEHFQCCEVSREQLAPTQIYSDADLRSGMRSRDDLVDTQMAMLRSLEDEIRSEENIKNLTEQQERRNAFQKMKHKLDDEERKRFEKNEFIRKQKRRKLSDENRKLDSQRAAHKQERAEIIREERAALEQESRERNLAIERKKQELLELYKQKEAEAERKRRKLEWKRQREELVSKRRDFLKSQSDSLDQQYNSFLASPFSFVQPSRSPVRPVRCISPVRVGDSLGIGNRPPIELDVSADSVGDQKMQDASVQSPPLISDSGSSQIPESGGRQVPESGSRQVPETEIRHMSERADEMKSVDLEDVVMDIVSDSDDNRPSVVVESESANEVMDIIESDRTVDDIKEDRSTWPGDKALSSTAANPSLQAVSSHEAGMADSMPRPLESGASVRNSGFMGMALRRIPDLPVVGEDLDIERFSPDEDDQSTCTPLEVIIRSGLVESVLAQCRVVDEVTLHLFRRKFRIVEHFHALKRYLLMDAGDMLDLFCGSFFDRHASSDTVFGNSPARLNTILEEAAGACGYDSDSYFSLLVFRRLKSALRIPTKYAFLHKALSAVKDVYLDYNIEWPLTNVITRDSLDRYNAIFAFFMKLKKVSLEMRSLWVVLRNATRRKYENAEQIRTLQMFYHEGQHFLDCLQYHCITQVLNINWDSFMQEVQAATCLDSYRIAHDKFIKKCTQVCFLTKGLEILADILNAMFNMLLEFKALVESVDLSVSLPTETYKKCLSLIKDFHRHALFPYSILSDRPETHKGSLSHTYNFMLRLDFNAYYMKLREASKIAQKKR
eukprot:178916_1